MGWKMPWYTITDGFDTDFGVDEWHGTNAFIRIGDAVFRTYFVNSRGDEALGSTWSYLDLTALGHQEDWENSPEGYPQTPPYAWWNRHDEYGSAERSECGATPNGSPRRFSKNNAPAHRVRRVSRFATQPAPRAFPQRSRRT
jgi:hypothetical protein